MKDETETTVTAVDIVVDLFKTQKDRWDIVGDHLCRIDVNNPTKEWVRFKYLLDSQTNGELDGTDEKFKNLRKEWWERQVSRHQKECK